MSFISLYLSHGKKKYDLSALILIVGCANIAVPWMFFTAGGNESGMQIWLIFSVVVTCMMSKGKIRTWITIITILEDIACMCVGEFYPETVKPLVGENAVFIDQVQSFAIVCVCLMIMLIIYISTYDKQRIQLEKQSIELRNMMQTDALTGLFNRRAYYDEISDCIAHDNYKDLVIVSMDLNGLKKVNDLLGHSAGDKYICEATKVIKQAIGDYGHIFRTGGDEFMAILHCSVKEANSFEQKIDYCINKTEGKWPEKMAIAIGVVCYEENSDLDITEIEKLADERMYENKAAYYKKNGIDRRK